MASAAILVGGRARRFGGRDKSALRVDGRTILEWQLAALAPLTDDVLISVGVGTDVESSFRWLANHVARVVTDRVPECGPLGGLDAALAAARDETLIVLACDMPCVTTALLAHLVAGADGVDAVVPRTERGYHPLCAVYNRRCHDAVARRLARRELAVTGVLEDVRVRVIEREEMERIGPVDRLLANVNTPREFDALEALLGHEP
jgi:molybdopterin-guanine dinucleotide biosynthesis protein A